MQPSELTLCSGLCGRTSSSHRFPAVALSIVSFAQLLSAPNEVYTQCVFFRHRQSDVNVPVSVLSSVHEFITYVCVYCTGMMLCVCVCV